MGSTYKRSFAKGLSWEVIAFVITFIAVYIVFGDFKISLGFSLILTLIKAALFFVHERLWKKIKWGIIKDKK